MQDETEEFRFFGVFESIGDRGQLWIRSKELTVQADLSNSLTYIFPNTGGVENTSGLESGGEVPERIQWDRISALTGDAKVFIGGALVKRENRRIFASLPEAPLLIIFYEGSEKALALRTVYSGRHRNEFLNFLTPYSFTLGAFSQILIAVSFFSRPAYRSTMISALVALFIPIIPWIPPGILFTVVYRRLWSTARTYRACRDLARLPLDTAPWKDGKDDFNEETVSGILRGDPRFTALSYNRKAFGLVIFSWFFLLLGIGINVFFIVLILSQIRA